MGSVCIDSECCASKLLIRSPGTVLETDLLGNPQSEYIFFGGSRIARRDVSGVSSPVFYYFANQIHSTALITDANGNIEDDADYYPWGGTLQFNSNLANHYWCTGKERDAESGLDYFGTRYYGNTFARFTSPDPMGGTMVDPQTLNKYSYVRDNPINFTDPTGMYTCKDSNDCSSEQDKSFEASRQKDLQSKDSDVVRAAKSYGDPTKDNGVHVGFADMGKGGEDGKTVSTLGADANGNLRAESDVTINSKATGAALDAAVGHEGSHVADAQDVVKSISITDLAKGTFKVGMNISRYSSEQRAYKVTDSIFKANNETRHYDCGVMGNCTLGVGQRGRLSDEVDHILATHGDYTAGGKPMSSSNQGGSIVNGLPSPQ